MSQNEAVSWSIAQSKKISLYKDFLAFSGEVEKFIGTNFSKIEKIGNLLSINPEEGMTLSAVTLQSVNVTLSQMKTSTLLMKADILRYKVKLSTLTKNLGKIISEVFKDDIKTFKTITDRQNYIDSIISSGCLSAIEKELTEVTTDPDGVNHVNVLPQNIDFDIKSQIDVQMEYINNLLSSIEMWSFTVKGIVSYMSDEASSKNTFQ